MRKHIPSILMLCVSALLTGCGSADKPALLEPPFGAVDGQAVRATELWPTLAQAGRVVVTDEGKALDVQDVTAEIGPGVWRMTVGNFWVVDVVRGQDGSVSALKEVEAAEERRVEYDPPLPLLPAELRAGEPIEFTSAVKLYNHANGALEATGECTATYKLLGTKSLGGGGLLLSDSRHELAYVVEVRRHYKLPLVGVEMHILSAYVPGEGPIAGRTVRVVKLLGLLPVVHEQSVERPR
ncbi:MAG: hypothetical protein R3C45_10130 [Phycisphaerales bacterium]